MDAAHVMDGYKGGLQVLIKRSVPEDTWTFFMIHEGVSE
jgi:hypothetical protein